MKVVGDALTVRKLPNGQVRIQLQRRGSRRGLWDRIKGVFSSNEDDGPPAACQVSISFPGSGEPLEMEPSPGTNDTDRPPGYPDDMPMPTCVGSTCQGECQLTYTQDGDNFSFSCDCYEQ